MRPDLTRDITLCGTSLEEWRQWVLLLRQQERLSNWAIGLNAGIVMLTLPLWMLARVIGVPLMLIDALTLRLAGVPFRLMSTTMQREVLWASDLWTQAPLLRPLLLAVQPVLTAAAMVLMSLAPEEPDIRETKLIMAQLWPLTASRLAWIAERGNGQDARA